MPEKKKVTIRDIARRANVSMSTVSRVLNETTPVAADKELAVLAAVADLDYQPNIFARGLAGGPVDDDWRFDPKLWQPLLRYHHARYFERF